MDQDLKLKKQNLARIITAISNSNKDSRNEDQMQPMLENGGHKNKKKRTSHSGHLSKMQPIHKIFK